MNKLGHLLFCAVFYTLVYTIASNYYSLNHYEFAITLVIALVYSLLPDIDKNGSWIRKKVDYILFLAVAVFGVLYLLNKVSVYPMVILLSIEVVLILVKHRGIIHSLAFGAFLAAPLLIISPFYFIAAMIGYISHLIADSF